MGVSPRALSSDRVHSERAVSVKTIASADRSAARVAGIAVLVSLFSFLYYFQRGNLLLYGDAVAHINIARRVFDSQTPGLLQLGTVWLPLPHLLMIPFLWPDAMWQNGAGGSIPSMITTASPANGWKRAGGCSNLPARCG